MFFILLLLYIFFFCVPGYISVYEKPYGIGQGCLSAIFIVLGFPGALLALFFKSARKAHWEESLRRIEAESRERAQETALLRKRKIEYFSNSPLLSEIIKFVTLHGSPYKISVYHDSIIVCRLNGTDVYSFFSHGIQDLEKNNIDTYALGHAINIALENRFTVKESRYGVDDELRSAELVRQLNQF